MVGLLAAMLIVGSLPAVGQANPAGQGPLDPAELEAFLDDFFAEEMAQLDIPGVSFVMVKDGEIFFMKGYGFADRENRLLVDPSETIFRIGSVSKPLTALAALQQVERGNLELEVDVNRYFDFEVEAYDGTQVTLASLLTHTAGFEDNKIGGSARTATELEPLGEFMRLNLPGRFEATGVTHSYANLGYGLAGSLVEVGSGREFVSYMDENVFEPFGMSSSSFAQDLPAELRVRLAVGYEGSAGGRTAAEWIYQRNSPAGGAVTTAADMGRFMVALLGGGTIDGVRVLEKEAAELHLASYHRPDPMVPGRTTGGLEELFINGERAVAHGGDIFSYSAQMVLLPDHATGFFVVYNAFDDQLRDDLITSIFDRYYPDTSAEPSQFVLSETELSRFDGGYRWTRYSRTQVDKILAMTPPYNTFVTANEDQTLTVSFLGIDERWVYRPIGPTTFTKIAGERAVVDGLAVDPGDTISFTIEDGEVKYLHLSLHTIAAERTPLWLMGVVQISAFGIIVLLFLASLLVWPTGALIRKWRGRQSAHGWARAALWLVVGVAVLAVAGMIALFLGLSSDVIYGVTPMILLATTLISLAGLLALALVPAAITAWARGWFTIGGRIYYSLLALSASILLWWANYWNILGFRF